MRRFYIIVAIICVLIAGWLIWSLASEYRSLADRALQRALAESEVSTAEIAAHLATLEHQAEDLADRLSSGTVAPGDLPEELRRQVERSVIFGAGVAYQRGILGEAIPPAERSWYTYRQDGCLVEAAKDYEYTDPDSPRNAWFTEPIAAGQGIWKEPKYGKTSETFITGYSTPFYTSAERSVVAGVVTMNYSLDELNQVVRSADIWDSGYAVLFSQNDRLIFHPNDRLVTRGRIHADADPQVRHEHPVLCHLAEMTGTSGAFDHLNDAEGRSVWTMSRPVGETGWRLGLVFYRDEVLSENHRARIIKRLLILFGVLGSIAGSLAILYHAGLTVPKLWGLSLITSTAFLIGVVIIWSHNLSARTAARPGIVKLKNAGDIEQLQSQLREDADTRHLEQPRYVRTGTAIRSINFSSANDVVVNGYIWQRYDLAEMPPVSEQHPDGYRRGLVFVEAFESDIDLDESEALSVTQGDTEQVLVWYFKVTLRQKFGYQQFPFDHEAVWLRLRHIDPDRNVVLIPDLHSYQMVFESASPGIDPDDFILPGWRLEGTYFNVEQAGENAQIRLGDQTSLGSTAELYYNIGIQRNFLDPFISNVTPVLIIFLVLFVVVLTSTGDPDRASRYGFNSFAVLGLVAALLFSTMFLHASLRNSLASPSVTYFECFFILAYLIMLLVASNAAALASHLQLTWVRDRNNLIPKLLFWPVTTAAVFVVTIVKLQV